MSTYHYDGSPCPESCTCAVRDRLRTQLEAVTRERDGYREALEMANAAAKTNAEERDEARAAVELVREECARDIARARDEARAPCHGLGCGHCESCVGLARADAARLREALEQRSLTFIGVDDLPGRNVEWRCEMCGRQERDGHAPDCALASVPSAEPTRAQAERWLSDGPEVPGGTLAFHAAPSAEPTPRSMTDCMMTHHPSRPCTSCEARRYAEADAARLREALEALVEYERKRHPPKMGGDEFPPSLREIMGIARAALASAPSDEPTPRDMRVAEAVREACVETADASDEASRRVAGDLRDLDLAAVVTEAVKP